MCFKQEYKILLLYNKVLQKTFSLFFFVICKTCWHKAHNKHNQQNTILDYFLMDFILKYNEIGFFF